MFSVEQNLPVSSQTSQISSSRSKRRSRSNERTSRTKSRKNDRDSSSSSDSDHDRDDDPDSLEDDDDDDDENASVSDRSSRESSTVKQKAAIRWDYRINITGRRIRDSKPLCCLSCQYPVVVVGRLIPCKHAAFCLQCAKESKESRRTCPKCNESVTDVESIEAENLILCHHGSHPNPQDACLRGYTSQRDLQAHVKRRHESIRLGSPHQLTANVHPTTNVFQGLMVDPQQHSQIGPPNIAAPSQVPPPLMAFPPIVPAPPRPIFDFAYRPHNYVLPPAQQFVPPQTQYRQSHFPPNRPFY